MPHISYPYLESLLDKMWLENHPDHFYNKWLMKPDDSKEKLLLSRFDAYVRTTIPHLHAKAKIQDKIRNQFVETYNELEVGCSLEERGFAVDFEKILLGERSELTPDLFIENEKVIMEVKTLHRSAEVKQGMKSGRVFTFNEAKRIENELFMELAKYGDQKIEHPLIVVVCDDVIDPPLVSHIDFETVLYYRVDKMIVGREYRTMLNETEYKGLYFPDYGNQTNLLSGVASWRWKTREMLFYPNPYVRENSIIPQGRLLNFLKENTDDRFVASKRPSS
jgi:hypothetical protein